MTQRPPLTVWGRVSVEDNQAENLGHCFQHSSGVTMCQADTAQPFSRYFQKGTENNIHYLSLQSQNSWHHLSSSVSGK